MTKQFKKDIKLIPDLIIYNIESQSDDSYLINIKYINCIQITNFLINHKNKRSIAYNLKIVFLW